VTLYARSDAVAVTVSAEAHGGCGKVHTRPVDQGKPATVWALTCHDCENHLRHDDLWASTLSKIPETHDEASNREETEKSHARQQQDVMVQSLSILAGNVRGGDVPQAPCVNGHQNPATGKFCAECGGPVARLEAVSCASGHDSPAGARFCVECGLALGVLPDAPLRVPESLAPLLEPDDPEPAAPPPALPPPVTEPAAAPWPGLVPEPPQRAMLPSNTKMRGMKRSDLLDLASTAGVDPGGTREQVLNRLIAANNA
jgi:hypothetical protein